MNPAERIQLEIRLDDLISGMDLPDRLAAASELLRFYDVYPEKIVNPAVEYLQEQQQEQPTDADTSAPLTAEEVEL